MVSGRSWLRWAVLAGLGLACGNGGGQTLAHKNWSGSGLTVQAWWARGVFCSVGPDLKRVAGEMDRLVRMGCDAVEVAPGDGFGAVAEMDGVMEAAGRGKMRVVVDLTGTDVAARMRFWGARGAAGFAVSGGVDAESRQAAAGRLVIGDGDGGQLRVRTIPVGDAAAVKGWMSGPGMRQGVLLEDGSGRLGFARAAMLLLSGEAARVAVDAVALVGAAEETREFSAEELLLWVPKKKASSDEMDEWLRGLAELHHGNASLRAGQAVLLDLDTAEVVGWMVPARDGRSGVVVVCNVSGKAVRVGLAGRLPGVKGGVLKTLLRSDGGAGGDSSASVELGADGVFVGEAR